MKTRFTETFTVRFPKPVLAKFERLQRRKPKATRNQIVVETIERGLAPRVRVFAKG